MKRTEDQRLRLEIATILDAIASHTGWSDELWSQFDALMKRVEVDGILAHADEELIHYSGQFNKWPRSNREPGDYKSEFRQLADAIRSGMTWAEYKRANRIYESGDSIRALKRVLERLLGR